MIRHKLFTVLLCVCVLTLISTASAIYDGVTYQGKVLVGDEPFTGTGQFKFAIVDESSTIYKWSNDGNYPPVATETVTVTDGLFNVILGEPDMEPLMTETMLENSDLVLRIWFDDGSNGMQLLSPDQKLTSTIFAGRAALADLADDADTVDGYNYSILWPTTLTSVKAAASNDFHNLGGIDDDIPDYQEVTGSAIEDRAIDANKLANNIDATALGFDADKVDGMDAGDFAIADHDHWGDMWTGSGIGLTLTGGATGLFAAGTSSGVYGETASDSGYGVQGRNTATSGSATGVYGYTESPSGVSVYGLSGATTGSVKGVYGRCQSTSGTGVFGSATATTGVTEGVYGLSYSSSGRGVFGYASSDTGSTQGVYGIADSDEAKAVYGYASSSDGENYGVWGQSVSDEGVGVHGYTSSTTGTTYGVSGFSHSSTGGAGVYGRSDGSGDVSGVIGQTYSTQGQGVRGVAGASSGLANGVEGTTSSGSGYGVHGSVTATTGSTAGVYGETSSSTGRGIEGQALTTSGVNYGVYGETVSTQGYGVAGIAEAASGYTKGVYGKTESTVGRAVYGWSNANSGLSYGVYGRGDSLTGAGVLAENYYNGAGLQAFSYNGNSIEGHSGSPGSGYLRYYVDQNGISYADGGHQTFKRTGKIVGDKEECRTLAAINSPGRWYEDFGLVTFTGDELKVAIDPEFAAVANLEMTYHVYLTQEGGFCPLYIAERTPEYFVLRVDSDQDVNVTVHYRIVARERGAENKRMETIRIPVGSERIPPEQRLE